MKLIKVLFLSVCVLGVIHCRDESPVKIADLVLINGNIVTVDENNPRADALAVKGDTIVAVASNKKIRKYIDKKKTEIIDLQGKLALPGFNDGHVHFVYGGHALMSISLDGVTSFGEIQERVRDKVKSKNEGEWISGRGWDQEILPGKRWPTKELLDEVAPNNPVDLSRICGHCTLVNSYVLRISGITKDTPNPPGGIIVKDSGTGEPTGILHEKAMDLIKQPQLSDRESHEMDKKAVKLAVKEAAKYGVTSVHDLDGKVGVFKELLDEGELTVRVYAGEALTSSPEKLLEYKEWKQMLVDNNHMLKFGVIKGFIDGSLGSSTALLAEPYKNNPSTSGLLLMTQEELNDIVARIEHATVIIPEDIPRFNTLGVIPSVQPVFGPSYGQTIRSFFEDRLGTERAKYTNIWKTLAQANARLAFGTDWPVESLDPMEGIYSAVSRKSISDKAGNAWLQDESLSVKESVEFYTLGSAYASFEEDIKGSLQVGKLADIVVLSKDIFTIPEEEILNTDVVTTILGGKIIYSSEVK